MNDIKVNQMFLSACGSASFDVKSIMTTAKKNNNQVTSSIEAFQRIVDAKDCPKKIKEPLLKIIERMKTLNLSNPEDIAFLESTAKELESLARPSYTVGI